MKRLTRKLLSLLLTVSLLLGILPVAGSAIELTAGEFNPNTGLVRVDFDLQLTQEVSIEVLVDGEHFGWLLNREELAGYDGAMTSHDPCDTYDLPETFDTSHTAGVAADDEVQVCSRLIEGSTDESEVDESQGDGHYTILWNGSIDGHPVVGVNPDSDSYELTIWVRPQGYPDLGITSCEDDGEGGMIHGEDWIWTQQFAKDVSISMDYATILGAEGLEQLFIALQGGKSMEAIMEFLSGLSFNSNFVNLASLAQDIYSNDPVNLIDGSYQFDYTDLKLEGQIPLAFKRFYHSRSEGGALGQGFTHSFDYTLRNEDGFVHIALPGGEEFIFLKLRDFEDDNYYGVQNDLFTLTDGAAGGYDLCYKDGSAFHFNADGQLTSITNLQGKTVYTLTYNGDKLTEISGLAGTMTLSYGGEHIESVTDSAGRSVLYAYDGDNLISVTNPDDNTLTYTYDGSGYIATASDFEGETYVKNTYDERGRVTHQVFTNAGVATENSFSYDDENLVNTLIDASGWETKYYYDEYRHLLYTEDANGKTLSDYSANIAKGLTDKEDNELAYELDENGNITKINYPDNTSTVISYNANNLVTKVTYADGGSVSYTYDTLGNVTEVEDQNGHSTYYAYNADYLPTSVTDALGNSTTYAYDGNGRLLSVTDAEGGVTSYTYDAVGRIRTASVKMSDTVTATTSYEYSPAGKLLKVTDAENNVTEYEYNANGFTTKTTDALGGTVTTVYGTNGQKLSETDANGNETEYTYNDTTALLETVTVNGDNTTTYEYDERGNLVKTTDALNHSTEYEYDVLDRLVKVTDAEGGETKYEYDCMSRTTSVTDAEGNETTYTYDAVGRTKTVTNALNGKTTYTYDKVGNLLSTKDAENNTTETEYNEVNLAVLTKDAEGNETTYAYDKVGRLLSVTDALSGVTSYTYDLAGNLLSATDANGNVTKYAYDKLGRTVTQTNADNSTLRYAYDALGRVVEQYDELNHKTAYTYDGNGNVLTVTDPRGSVTAYTYNAYNQIATVTYADGGMVGYAYNVTGQLETVTDQRSNVTSYTYDALGRTKTVTDAENHITEYFYDAVGNVTKTQIDGHTVSRSEYDDLYRVTKAYDGNDEAAQYEYDAVGNVTKYIDRNGNRTSYAYNKNYRLTKVTDALNGETVTAYDALGRTVSVTDAEGNTTAYTYDAAGNVLTVTDALSGVITYTYDSRNRAKTVTDKLSAVTTYTYDVTGNVTKETDNSLKDSTYTYDANGNLTQYTNRENEWVQYAYDCMNRTIKETDPLNHATETAYDLCGNIVSVTDGNKHTTTYTYDGLNRISSVTSAEGSVTEYTYNALGNVASLTVDGGNNTRATTTYAYDGEGNLLSETDAAGSATTYTYDGEGNALTKTDRSGQETTFTYDDLNRLTKRTDADGTATFAYDKVGNLTSATDATGTVTFAYDALYRTTQVNDNGAVIGYAYNAANQRTDIVYPDGKTVTTAYDVMGNVTSLTDYDGSFIAYDRDAEGRVIKEAHSDGSTTEYDYNKAGQLVEQKEVAPDNATRRKILYGYDDAGNLTSENRTGVDFDRRDESVRYYYDKDNRLVKTTVEGVTTEYAYDLAGNLLSDGEATYTYDTQNRLLSKTGANGTITYEYDAAGNLVKETSPDGTVSYTYNAQNKLVKGELSDGQSSTYTYNALGARIENVQVRTNENAGYQNADLTDGSHGADYLDFLRNGRATWQRAWESEIGTVHQNDFETVTRHYVVDYLSAANRDLVATEDGSYVTRYVYDENSVRISAEFDYADGTQRDEAGENLQSDFAVEREKVWYRQSHLGSTLFAVDASGEVVAHAIYDAWGNPLTETYPDTNFSGFENLNNYTGYTYDETLDLYFAQNRFYDAENHRFTQEDIIKDGSNWYAYCGNNPTGYVDVWGLTPTDDLWALDLGAIRSISVEGKTYYNLRDIYSAVGGTPFWSSYSSTASFTISTSIAGRHVKSLGITVQQGGSPRVLSDGTAVYQGNVIGSSDTDYFTDTISIYNRGGTNYVSYEELFSYFERLWCEGKASSDQPKSTGSNTSLRPSNNLVEFLKGYEAFCSEPYYATEDEKRAGQQTIGYGHLIVNGERFTSITEQEATNLLLKDIERHIPDYLMKKLDEAGVQLKQCEFDALVSLCYNLGKPILSEDNSPNFNKYLLTGNYNDETTRAEFLTYARAKGKILPGLVKRRNAEADMFSYGIYNSAH